jgi:hypothetical protein
LVTTGAKFTVREYLIIPIKLHHENGHPGKHYRMTSTTTKLYEPRMSLSMRLDLGAGPELLQYPSRLDLLLRTLVLIARPQPPEL